VNQMALCRATLAVRLLFTTILRRNHHQTFRKQVARQKRVKPASSIRSISAGTFMLRGYSFGSDGAPSTITNFYESRVVATA
jgi:hypothetical protein